MDPGVDRPGSLARSPPRLSMRVGGLRGEIPVSTEDAVLPLDLATRGLLPKFRPATLGGREASLRPVIRPVRPTAPPPPPAPPRRREPHGPAIEDADDDGLASYGEPPTMAAARERLHAIARDLPRDHAPRFEEQTRGRIDGAIARYSPRDREHYETPASYAPAAYDQAAHEESFEEDEPLEAETSLRNEPYVPADAPNSYYPSSDRYASGQYEERASHDDAPYSAAPAPSYARSDDSGARERPAPTSVPYDNEAYETSYPGVDRRGIVRHALPQNERDFDVPVESHDDSQSRRRENAIPQAQMTRREDSGARRPSENAALITEMKVPANFVVGVQPIRQPVAILPATPSFPPVDAPAMAMPAPAGTMAASPRAMQAGQQQPMVSQAAQMHVQMQPAPLPHMPALMPTPMMQPGMMPPGMMPGQRVPTTRPPFGTTPRPVPSTAHPVGHQLQTTAVEEAAQGSKVGRFAWFVFGAAFGIFFAFFATGFVPRIGKKEEIVFPPVAQVPAATAATAAATQAPNAQAPNAAPTFAPVVNAAPTYATPGAPMTTTAPAMPGSVGTVAAMAVPAQPAPITAQPTAAPMMTAAPVGAQPTIAPQPQPAYAAAPTPVQRAQAPRPRFTPVRRGPRNASGSNANANANAEDERPASKPSEGAGDLLNAGLGN